MLEEEAGSCCSEEGAGHYIRQVTAEVDWSVDLLTATPSPWI